MNKIKIISTILVLSLLTGCLPFINQTQTVTPEVTLEAPKAAANTQFVQYDNTALLNTSVLAVVQQTFQQIYESVNPSVVNIQVTSSNGWFTTSAEGSGFIWDDQGHIITNNHVIDNASQINVVFTDGTSVEAKLVGADPESDLAVISIDPKSVNLVPVTMGDSHSVQVGDLVIAIGNPYGLSGTMTQGIVSALSRSLTVDQSDPLTNSTYTIPDIVQTDAAINPGNSGGVLVNVKGQVIGVTSAIRSSTDSNSGIGFVIPSHIVQRVVPVLIKNGSYTHPRLGLSGITLTSRIAEQIGLDAAQQGILVVDVTANGPADKVGLIATTQQVKRSGQTTFTLGDLITAVDGIKMKTYEDLISYLFNNTDVGQTITLTVLRNGEERDVNLKLGNIS
jgi:serine protease Do